MRDPITIEIPEPIRRPNGQISAGVFDALRVMYGLVPEAHCKGLCYDECIHITMTPIEIESFRRKGLALPMAGDDRGRCSHLTPENRCAVYHDRPMVCRMYGAVPVMVCPHGCVPMDDMSDLDAGLLVQALYDLGELAGLGKRLYFTGGENDYAAHQTWAQGVQEHFGITSEEPTRRLHDYDRIEYPDKKGI